jgi:hypothetical protein
VHLGFCWLFFPCVCLSCLSPLFFSWLLFRFSMCVQMLAESSSALLSAMSRIWHRWSFFGIENNTSLSLDFSAVLSLSLSLSLRVAAAIAEEVFLLFLFGKPVSVFAVQSDFVSGFFCTGCSVVVSELEEIFTSSLLLHTHLSWHVDCGTLYDNTLSTNGSTPYLSHHHGRRRGTLLSISSSSCLCFWNARLNFLSSSKPSELSPSVVKNPQE